MSDVSLSRAAQILRDEAVSLRRCHTVDGDWTGEPDAKAAHEEMLAAADSVSAALARIEALERERDAALRSRDDWIRENGPGGWIDALRNLAKARAIQNETLMRALEIIAVGDSRDPAADAKNALVEAGCWTKEQKA